MHNFLVELYVIPSPAMFIIYIVTVGFHFDKYSLHYLPHVF